MYRMDLKERWQEYYEDLLEVNLELGMPDDEAEYKAGKDASEQVQDYLDEQGDMLYDQQKDARMERGQ